MKTTDDEHGDLERRIVIQAALLVLAILDLIVISLVIGWD